MTQNVNCFKLSYRKGNIELLRIIAMLFIIIHHLTISGIGLSDITNEVLDTNKLLYTIASLMNSFVIVGVNLFFLISGYFTINFNIRKIIALLTKLYVYTLLLNLLGLLFGVQKIDLETLKIIINPLNTYWFLLVYIILVLISPVLNVVIKHLGKKYVPYIFIIMLLFGNIYSFIYKIEILGFNRGYSLLSAICLYFIGYWINKYDLLSITSNNRQNLIVYIMFSVLNWIMCIISIYVFNSGKITWHLFSYNNPLIVFSSIFLFKYFVKLEVKENTNIYKIVTFLSTNLLGVYIIHSSNKLIVYIRNMPIQNYITNNEILSAFLILIPYSILILILCIAIDKVLDRILNKFIFRVSRDCSKLLKYIYKYTEKYIIKI